MIKKALCIFLLLLISGSVFAGDIATFLNLGFSEDSRYFMFGEYGLDSTTSTSYAELYIVDVTKNIFVQGGVIKKKYNIPLVPGNDGAGGLYSLLERNYSEIKRYDINHLVSGRYVYIRLNGDPPKSYLEFRDFNTGAEYAVTLEQSAKGSGKNVSADFHIKVSVTFKDGKKVTHTVGRPGYMRKGVKEYLIKYIILAPDSKSLVFVIEKHMVDSSGDNIRYMVETKKIY
jgi:predicted secreted protein